MQTEKDLYIHCCNGDDRARRELFERFLPAMHAICLRYASTYEEADDMVQEGFIRIFDKLDTFKWKGEGSFVSWIKTIFINTAISHYRKSVRNPEISIESNNFDFQQDDDNENTDSLIEQALEVISQKDIIESISQLPENFRIVFNLFALEGYKHKEIASMLQISIKTSTTRYLRAKAKLKVILSGKLNETLHLQR